MSDDENHFRDVLEGMESIDGALDDLEGEELTEKHLKYVNERTREIREDIEAGRDTAKAVSEWQEDVGDRLNAVTVVNKRTLLKYGAGTAVGGGLVGAAATTPWSSLFSFLGGYLGGRTGATDPEPAVEPTWKPQQAEVEGNAFETYFADIPETLQTGWEGLYNAWDSDAEEFYADRDRQLSGIEVNYEQLEDAADIRDYSYTPTVTLADGSQRTYEEQTLEEDSAEHFIENIEGYLEG